MSQRRLEPLRMSRKRPVSFISGCCGQDQAVIGPPCAGTWLLHDFWVSEKLPVADHKKRQLAECIHKNKYTLV